jgi:hypothetical protein
MKHFAILLFLFLLGVECIGQQTASSSGYKPPTFSYSVVPSFDMTANTTVSKTREIYNLQIGGKLKADFSYNVGRINLRSLIDARLSQKVNSDRVPERTDDDLVVSVIPSFRLYEEKTLTLALDVTLQTQMMKTEVDEAYTKSFMDPAFFYQTLYLGHQYEWKSEDKKDYFLFRHGLGYALQQTSYSRFVLTSDRLGDRIGSQNPLTEIQRKGGLKLESGVSYLIGLDYRSDLADDLKFRFETFGVMLSKTGFIGDPAESRAYFKVNPSLTFKNYLRLEYRLVTSYDKNYSKRRKLIQELTIGITYDLHN